MNAGGSCVAVTCGPGYEPIDAVRRMTNMSTGALGAALAEHLRRVGYRVLLLRGEMATAPIPAEVEVVPFGTGTDLLSKIEALSREVLSGQPLAGFFHAAALCDYRVAAVEGVGDGIEVGRGKIPTQVGELTLRLEPAVKLLPRLRPLFPGAWIAGWKFEVDGGREMALRRGEEQIVSCGTDLCVVNGPAYGPGFGLVDKGGAGAVEHVGDVNALADALIARMEASFGRGDD